MKRLRALWLIVILSLCLAGCGKKDGASGYTNNVPKASDEADTDINEDAALAGDETTVQEEDSTSEDKTDQQQSVEGASESNRTVDLGSLSVEDGKASKGGPKTSKGGKANSSSDNDDDTSSGTDNPVNDVVSEETEQPTAGEVDSNSYYVDMTTGDADSIDGSTTDMIFLDSVNLLTADYPLNKIDSILADISTPIVAEYGNIDYVYELTNYTAESDTVTTFNITAKDQRKFKVTIEKKGENYKVNVQEEIKSRKKK